MSNPSKIILSTLAFVLATFIIQPLSHFVVNVDHFASIDILRPEPIFALGFVAMLVQGLIMGLLYSKIVTAKSGIGDGINFALLMGFFLSAYIGFAEPAKYTITPIWSWMVVEISASVVQFSLYGALLGWIFSASKSS